MDTNKKLAQTEYFYFGILTPMTPGIPTHAAKAVIKNHADEILFLQRNPEKGAISSWDLPGGLLEEGETEQEALAREVEEELGVVAMVGNELGKWSFYRPIDGVIVEVTNYKVTVEDTEFSLSDEHVDFMWVPAQEIINLPIKDQSLLGAIDYTKA